jgi:Co/Zn/Cd efflux system component
MKSHGVEYQPDSVAADLAGVRLSRAAAPPQSHRYNIICGVHLTNRFILWVSAISFTLFVAAEIVGAIFGNSLALLGDAAAMSVDVIAVSFPRIIVQSVVALSHVYMVYVSFRVISISAICMRNTSKKPKGS